MSKILFACDLDNTLIHSWKYKQEGDICVEWIDGKEQGYMSSDVVCLLQRVRQLVEFVPVTTRSIAQYQRIVWPYDCCPQRAITTHGAILLDNGKINEEWEAETRMITDRAIESLSNIVTVLEGTGEYLRCRMVDQAYAFVYCKNDSSAVCTAMTYPLPEGIYRVQSGKKVYFIPNGIDKGNAVLRLGKDKGFDTVMCAGDSEMDTPMLKVGNASFVPNALGAKLSDQKNIHVCSDKAFAKEMLCRIEAMIQFGAK